MEDSGTADGGDTRDKDGGNTTSSFASELASDEYPVTGVYEVTEYRTQTGACDAPSASTPPAPYFVIARETAGTFTFYNLGLCDALDDCSRASTEAGLPNPESDTNPIGGNARTRASMDTCTLESGEVFEAEPTDEGYIWRARELEGPVDVTADECNFTVLVDNIEALSCTSITEWEGRLLQ